MINIQLKKQRKFEKYFMFVQVNLASKCKSEIAFDSLNTIQFNHIFSIIHTWWNSCTANKCISFITWFTRTEWRVINNIAFSV